MIQNFDALLSHVLTGESDEEIAKIEEVIKALTEKDIERAELIDFLKIKMKTYEAAIEMATIYDFESVEEELLEVKLEITKFTRIIELLRESRKLMSFEEFGDSERRDREYLRDYFKEKEDE